MDRFIEMFHRQLKLQQDIYNINPDAAMFLAEDVDEEKREESFRHGLLLVMKECTEALDEINYKLHYKKKKCVDRKKLLIELIDIYKYWLNLCIIYGYSAQEVYEAFNEKSDIVEKKIMESLRENK